MKDLHGISQQTGTNRTLNVTQAISSDKFSSHNRPTSRKDDTAKTERQAASPQGRAKQADPVRLDDFQASGAHYAQRLESTADGDGPRDAADAARVLAQFKGALSAKPQSALLAHAAVNPVSVEAALAAPLK